MINLDSFEEIKRLDKNFVLDSIKSLPEQIKQTWYEVKLLKIPSKFSLAKNVVICGMGGSALGGRMIDSLIPDRVRTPIEVFTEYHLPNYVNKDTLVIVNSYSGNTEETLSSTHEAIKKHAQIFVITTGGKLADLAKREKLPLYEYEAVHNPSKQPRMALGYSVAAMMSLLSRTNFIHITDEEVENLLVSISGFIEDFDIENKSDRNMAKNLSQKLFNKLPVLIASEHLVGSAHAFKNQLNETAKTFSNLFDLPELNHHLMEGLKNPPKAKEILDFVFLESQDYSERVQKRYPITKEVLEKNSVEFLTYKCMAKTKFEQMFEVLTLGMFVAFYLAMLYQIDPSRIPWVDYFKDRLKN